MSTIPISESTTESEVWKSLSDTDLDRIQTMCLAEVDRCSNLSEMAKYSTIYHKIKNILKIRRKVDSNV